MATDLERLVVSLEANTKRFEAEMKKAAATTNSELRKVEARAKAMQKNVNSSFADLGKGLAIGGATAGLTAGIMAFKDLADAATRTQNSLKVAGLSGDELTRVYRQLFEAAQDNAAPVEDLVKLYGRVAINQNELGVSTSRLIGFTNNVAKALRVQGTSAQEAQGALLQLSQALGGGVVRAEEFNAILEGAPTILQAVAAGFDKANGSVAELRKIMLAGGLSSKDFFDAFERGAPILDKKLAGSVLTVDQALIKMRNSLQDSIGRINEATGITAGAVEIIGRLATAVDSLGRAFSAVSQSDAGAFIGKVNEIQSAINPLYRAIEGLETLVNKLPGMLETTPMEDAADAAEKLANALEMESSTMLSRLGTEQKKQLADLAAELRAGTMGANEFDNSLFYLGSQFEDVRKRLQPLIDKLRETKEAADEIKLDELTIDNKTNPVPDSILQAQEDMKRSGFFNQRNADAMKTDLEKNVDTRAKAIIDAAAKVGVALTEAAAKVQARAELATEAGVARTGRVSSDVTELIKGFESFRSTPYWDVNAMRVGYGSDTVTLADGSIQKVVAGMKVSVEDANRDLTRRIGEFQDTIRGQIGSETFAAMNDSQQAALTSIAYNYGSLPEKIVSAIRTGSTESIYNAIKGLGTDNGGINAGRRQQEANLFLTGASPSITKGIESKQSFQEKLADQQRMLAQLKEESGIRASLNPLINDYGQKLTELEKAQELLNMAQQEGTAAGKELTSATQLLNGDLSGLTPEARAQAEAMRALAQQYGLTTAAANQLKASQEAAAKSSAESLELAKSVTGGILSDIRSALSDGKITWKEWGEIAVNALNKVADKLQEMLLNQLFSPTSTGGGFLSFLTGGGTSFNPLTATPGLWASGGYTGAGGKYEPAGIVHKGEYVFDQDTVKRLGLDNLEALHRGYANGGLVGGAPRLPDLAGMATGRGGGGSDGLDIAVRIVKEGLNLEPEVVSITRREGRAGLKLYRENQLHKDIDSHRKRPRRMGSI